MIFVAALYALHSSAISPFPIWQGRSSQQVGKKSRDKGRWSIGIRLCWLLNELAWDWATMNVNEKNFHHLAKPLFKKPLFSLIMAFVIKVASKKVSENLKE